MPMTTCCLLGAPIGTGAGLPGCEDGPGALRRAGLAEMLAAAGA
ncbi:arginase, partial [Mangrovicoccus sp. HB182678]|nr:arginase [Mangrovicoccus algicola]